MHESKKIEWVTQMPAIDCSESQRIVGDFLFEHQGDPLMTQFLDLESRTSAEPFQREYSCWLWASFFVLLVDAHEEFSHDAAELYHWTDHDIFVQCSKEVLTLDTSRSSMVRSMTNDVVRDIQAILNETESALFRACSDS